MRGDEADGSGAGASFAPEGSGDEGRPLVVRDSSKGKDGEKGELGRGHASILSVVSEVDGSGVVTKETHGFPQPRNYHLSELDLLPGSASTKDRRISIALIADYEHPFSEFKVAGGGGGAQLKGDSSAHPAQQSSSGGVHSSAGPALARLAGAAAAISAPQAGFADLGGVNLFLSPPITPNPSPDILAAQQFAAGAAAGAAPAGGGGGAGGGGAGALPDDPSNPWKNDWSAKQKSTRIIDYDDPKGRSALFSQLCKVIDSLDGKYVAAIPLARLSSAKDGSDSIATGYLWDNTHDNSQCGLLDTVFEASNPNDILGNGREGTPSGILGIRHDAHFEHGEDKHGRLYLDTLDVSSYRLPSSGIRFRSTLGFDSSAANADSANGHESGEWRPWYVIPFTVPETTTTGDDTYDSTNVGNPASPPTPYAYGNGVISETVMSGNTSTGALPSLSNVASPTVVAYQTTYRSSSGVNTAVMAQSVPSINGGATFWGMGLPASTVVGNGIPNTAYDLTVASQGILTRGGISSPGTGANSERFGASTLAPGIFSVAVGPSAKAYTDYSVSVGRGAIAGTSGGIDQDCIAIGDAAIADGSNCVATGDSALAGGAAAAYGHSADARTGGGFSSVFGWGATATSTAQFVAGAGAVPMTDIYFGKGISHATPTAYALNGTSGSGSNITGGGVDLTSRGTGSATGGPIRLRVSAAGGSGTTLRTALTRLQVAASSTTFFNSDLSTLVDFGADNKVGFFGATRVSQQTAPGAITDSSTGTPSTTFADAGGSYSQAGENDFRASVASQLTAFRTALNALGLTA